MLYKNIVHLTFTSCSVKMYFNNTSVLIEPKLPEIPIMDGSSEEVFESVMFIMLGLIICLTSVILYFVITLEKYNMCNCCKNSKCTVISDIDVENKT